ncbi:hypothetical protein BDR07DRAFT_1421103 [Suillus spraguei]|nr:hypothetical protein BDR07DRAFT_1421103 [Suillus spraguei]
MVIVINSDPYKLLISSVALRPIAFMSMISVEPNTIQLHNVLCTLTWLASFSWFNTEGNTTSNISLDLSMFGVTEICYLRYGLQSTHVFSGTIWYACHCK